ncbi:hypothetical protein A2454_02370 [Candidatus Peribacteria bacterium RIFOXYC2_FULL_55_14]|nr:MAG: hypothetical protein UY85_C0002G0015 [Candidatus Peribacteria bacterium GW2011_GWB1_54_5]KKW42195.1 MAG: hypothetical protein UY90_C0040G0016 [Candidatus Peregrinibacteria bacterium GW2011_GWA2_54_9]OGJ74374.1 MAG: hypothetical protein A2384_06635 [Candidatus Peribacteria bacterium RIFOXYB1_FULL_54_35]OGJ75992.1 MAG: hypothetical protein A2327_03780 [Candidatus Peribacteria bacterium RIFOXYB2_FULL_54_17]OGJ80105.1 MAG: hypothetical protein A2454_02370 [Candidatus Peribacteria bacterium 
MASPVAHVRLMICIVVIKQGAKAGEFILSLSKGPPGALPLRERMVHGRKTGLSAIAFGDGRRFAFHAS